MKLASTAMQSSTVGGLYQQVTQWDELADMDFTHVAVVARPRPAGLGYEAIIFAGQRLGDLVPELIGHGRDQFFSVCPLCGNGQSGVVLARKRTVFLECPDCHRVYAVVAVDTHGVFHYPSQYLKGYAPNVYFPAKRKLSRLAEMARIWDEVIHTVEYVPDSADGLDDNDAWQVAQETERLGTGDCEDSSIYLADWLASRGFEVRVALGHYGDKGGHAWVVVRLEGNCYLLETTDSHANVARPPMTVAANKLYVPDALFDREATYVRRFPNTQWSGDYFAPDQWARIEPPGTKSTEAVAAHVTGTTNATAKSPGVAPSPH
jgi:predicted transglutaminase-like cysteine proteinase